MHPCPTEPYGAWKYVAYHVQVVFVSDAVETNVVAVPGTVLFTQPAAGEVLNTVTTPLLRFAVAGRLTLSAKLLKLVDVVTAFVTALEVPS
jgi:hypothetical protein